MRRRLRQYDLSPNGTSPQRSFTPGLGIPRRFKKNNSRLKWVTVMRRLAIITFGNEEEASSAELGRHRYPLTRDLQTGGDVVDF